MQKKKKPVPELVKPDGGFQTQNLEVRHKSYNGESCLHWHNYYELEYVKSGRVIYQYNGKEYILSAGTAYLVTPSDYHKVTGINAELYNIAFNDAQVSPELLERLIHRNGSAVVHFEGEGRESAEHLLRLLCNEYDGSDDLREFALRRLFENFLICFIRAIQWGDGEQQNYSSAVMQTVSFVHLHFKEKITLRKAAEQVHLTPNYLGELFKNELGTSFSTYLMQTRLTFARNLLRRTGCTVVEAAIAAGFTSQTYFSECFKKEYGYSPAKERAGRSETTSPEERTQI